MTPDTSYSTIWTGFAAHDSVPRTASSQTSAATAAIQDRVSGSDDPQVNLRNLFHPRASTLPVNYSEDQHMVSWIVPAQMLLIAAVVLGPLAEQSVRLAHFAAPTPATAGALALTVSGILLILTAAAAMGRSLTVQPWPRGQGRLITSGVFRLCRNPVYLGLLLAGLGWSMAAGSRVALLSTVALAALLLLKIHYEEQFLLKRFGAEYEEYMRSVKRLIPFVW
jgi:protein-S-isoprenylcysteine O-methyltransferase Ste14